MGSADKDGTVAHKKLVEQLATRPCDLEPFDIPAGGEVTLRYCSNFTKPDFEQAVRKCVEYIKAGDIFQVVFPGQATQQAQVKHGSAESPSRQGQ